MQKALSSLLLFSGIFIAFSGVVAHADGPSMQDMYSKMGFSWGNGSGGSHGQSHDYSGTQHHCEKTGNSGQPRYTGGQHDYIVSQLSPGPQQPPQGQPSPSEALRKALELNSPIDNIRIDNSLPPATTTRPGT